MTHHSIRKIHGLAALLLVVPAAPSLEAGNAPLRRKCLVMGATVAGAGLLGTRHMLQHGMAHHPVAGAREHSGTQPLPAVPAPADLAADNRTEPVLLNITLPEPPAGLNGTAAEGEAAGESKAAPVAQPQDEAARVDALVRAAQEVFAESLCPGALQSSLRAHSRHRERRAREAWSQERTDAWYRNQSRELSSPEEVRNYQERVGTALQALNSNACLLLRKYRESGKPYQRKRGTLKERILNLRRLQAQLLEDELDYNKRISSGFWFAQEQAELGHFLWEEAPGTLPYRVRLEAADTEWERMDRFVTGLMDTLAPILVEMLPANTTAQAKGRYRWRFKLGWL
jgi:hypothetical protein